MRSFPETILSTLWHCPVLSKSVINLSESGVAVFRTRRRPYTALFRTHLISLHEEVFGVIGKLMNLSHLILKSSAVIEVGRPVANRAGDMQNILQLPDVVEGLVYKEWILNVLD